jgi:hypothetical protein
MRGLPMDLADAAIVRVAERERIRHVHARPEAISAYRPAGLGRLG